MKIFISAIFLFTTLFVALVVLIDGSNDIIEMQRQFLILQTEKEKIHHKVVELEYQLICQTNERELLKQFGNKEFSHLEFRGGS